MLIILFNTFTKLTMQSTQRWHIPSAATFYTEKCFEKLFKPTDLLSHFFLHLLLCNACNIYWDRMGLTKINFLQIKIWKVWRAFYFSYDYGDTPKKNPPQPAVITNCIQKALNTVCDNCFWYKLGCSFKMFVREHPTEHCLIDHK